MNDRPNKIELTVLPPIPAKRYFTIGEVSELCGVKPHVLRYWEQEFTQLKPVKRRGNRRYYQHHEVLLIRRIRELLYEQGFTISGARNRLDGRGGPLDESAQHGATSGAAPEMAPEAPPEPTVPTDELREELRAILALLRHDADA
jgi:DNA-binding transcriptional MerR regulator